MMSYLILQLILNKYLKISRSFKDKLPKHAHRALLLGVEAKNYLTELERYNFDILNDHFKTVSFVKLPLRIMKAAKAGYY